MNDLKTELLMVRINPTLKRKLKVAAFHKDITMSELVTRLIEKELKQEK